MQVMISYFYQIRFFTPNIIPLSTAMYDPKWYHDFRSQDYHFRDRNGVFNGFKITQLIPQHFDETTECTSGKCSMNPPNCTFLQAYLAQLRQIDCRKFISDLEERSIHLLNSHNISGEPVIAFIVHEAPSKVCSERIIIDQWLTENHIPHAEFSR